MNKFFCHDRITKYNWFVEFENEFNSPINYGIHSIAIKIMSEIETIAAIISASKNAIVLMSEI